MKNELLKNYFLIIMSVVTKNNICSCCLEEIRKNGITNETPLFYRVMVGREYTVNKCAFHYILNIEEPPMFLEVIFNHAYIIFLRYYNRGYIDKRDVNYFSKVLNQLKNK
jgi:hypothetical protein